MHQPEYGKNSLKPLGTEFLAQDRVKCFLKNKKRELLNVQKCVFSSSLLFRICVDHDMFDFRKVFFDIFVDIFGNPVCLFKSIGSIKFNF